MLELVATCDKCKKEFRYNVAFVDETHRSCFGSVWYNFAISDDRAPYFKWLKNVDGHLFCEECAKEYARYKQRFISEEGG